MASSFPSPLETKCGLGRSATIGGFEVREYHLEPGYSFPLHVHQSHGMVLVESGRFVANIEGCPWTVEPSTALLLPSGAEHHEVTGVQGATCYLLVPAAASLEAAELRPRLMRPRALRDPSLVRAAARGCGRIVSDPGMRPETLSRSLTRLLTSLGQAARSHVPDWLRMVRLKAHESPGSWSVGSLAASARVAPETLARRFAGLFGMTPSECLRANRLEVAARRLVESDESISSIAYSLGFADQSHLTNSFRSRFGVTPGVARRSGRVA